MDSEEQQLIERAVKGDGDAFAELLNRYYMMIYKTAYKWTWNKSDAEDVAQEVCIKLGRVIGSFRGEAKFSSWVYRIVLNHLRDEQRARHEHLPIEDEAYHLAADDNPAEELERKQLWREVKELPPPQDDAVLLVYAQGLSHAEAALILNCAESTVSWYIHEAKKQLKARLQ